MNDGAKLRVLLTGASGFVGGHLLSRMRREGATPRVLARRPVDMCETVIADLAAPTQSSLAAAMAGVHQVMHCAGFAHAFDDKVAGRDSCHEQINFHATRALAEAAAAAGVRRFVFCSTVKAAGDPGRAVGDEDSSLPADTIYGISKRNAELSLLEVADRTDMEVVILRLAMVYGPGSRGNIERMLRLVKRGVFPPLPNTGNRRSIVFVEDVVDALRLGQLHPAAANRTFIVAHPQAISGAELYASMCLTCGRKPNSMAVPASMLRFAGRVGDRMSMLLGRRPLIDSQIVSRLLDSAEYSSARIQTELGWVPRHDLANGLSALTLPDNGLALSAS